MRFVVLLSCGLLVACGKRFEPPADASAPEIDARAPRDAGVAGEPDGGVGRCLEGSAIPCACDDGGEGYRYCLAADTPGSCECAPVAPADAGATLPDGGLPGCTGDPEWCDGLDNDCDGVIDEGHPCADSSVRHALPYAGPVYSNGDPACGFSAVWPDTSLPDLALGDRCYDLVFRRTDGVPVARVDGVLAELGSGAAGVISTPPCFDMVGGYGFDAAGVIHYQCDDTLRRGNGELVATIDPSFTLDAVLGSGRTIVYTSLHFYLLDADGSVISRPRVEEWVGELVPIANATTVAGDSAFVGYNRVYRGGTRIEVVVFRVDGSTGSWRVVRRIPIGQRTTRALVLPDATLVYTRRTDGVFAYAHPPNGAGRLMRAGSEAPAIQGLLFPYYGP